MVQTIDLIQRSLRPPDRAAPAGAAERLIEAAGPLFAARGFDGVSTREVTRAAGVNLSAITYHFDGKEGLYRAVLGRIVADLRPARQAMLADLGRGIAAAQGDKAGLAQTTLRFVRQLIHAAALPAAPVWRLQLLLHEVGQPSESFGLILDQHIGPVHDAVAALVGAARGESPASPRVCLLAQSVLTLCLQFRFQQSIIQARLGWSSYGADELHVMVRTIGAAVLAMLALPPPAEETPP